MAGRKKGLHNGQTEIVRAERRCKAAALYVQGKRQHEIAKALGVCVSLISRDLKHVQAEWLESSLRDWDKIRAEELGKVDELERTAWMEWERSQKNAESTVITIDDEGGEKITKTSKGQCGDPRYLERVGWCIERRCKLLGLDAPVKVDRDDTGPAVRPINVIIAEILEVTAGKVIEVQSEESSGDGGEDGQLPKIGEIENVNGDHYRHNGHAPGGDKSDGDGGPDDPQEPLTEPD